MRNLNELKYSKEHEWVSVERNMARIGITDYAQHALGNIVFVELPSLGQKLKAEDVLGVVESVKAASDIYSPVIGTVAEVNEELEDSPENINSDPYGSWIATVELEDLTQLDSLMNLEEYEKFCAEEA